MKNPTDKTSRASLELLYHISREIAATLDLNAILQRVLFLSMKNIGAFSGSIIAIDENNNPVASTIIHNKRIIKQPNEQLRITLNKGLAGWVVYNKRAELIPDTSRDDRWLVRPDDKKNAGGKSAICVPFVAHGQVTGVITLVYKQPNFFKLSHLELVQAIADQAAVAVLNARLYQASKRQARVMTIIAKSANAITATLKLEQVFQQIVDQTYQSLQVEVVSLASVDHQTQEIEFQASTYQGTKHITGIRLPFDQSVAGSVIKNGQTAIVPDVSKYPRFNPKIDRSTGLTTSAIACAPIMVSGDVFGVIEARNPLNGLFDTDTSIILTSIGKLAGSAIQNALTYTEMLASHKRYQNLFDRNINSMLITNFKGQVLEGNLEAANLFGCDKESLINQKIEQLHPVNHKKLRKDFAYLHSGETLTYETIVRTPETGDIPTEVRVHAIEAEGSSYLLWFFRNIQERKELDQLRDDLLSSIYHDLRSPLSNVISSLDVLANMLSLEGNPAIESLFNIAVRSTERIQRLTNSLLDINRLEAGHPIVNLQPAKPNTLIQDTLEALSPIAKNKNQHLSAAFVENLPLVFVDADMVRRVLINLTENAIKFTPPEGSIKIGSCPNSEWVLMWVEDTGPGIAPDKRSRIFEKFTQLHDQGSPSGFGFGLAYCRLAIEGHGGRIWIDDKRESGARFMFTLPIYKDSK